MKADQMKACKSISCLFAVCASLLAASTAAQGSVIGGYPFFTNSGTTAQSVNLTTQGTADWKAWGRGLASDVDEKVRATAIGNISLVGSFSTSRYDYTGSPGQIARTWTDGTPTTSITGNTGSISQKVGSNGNPFLTSLNRGFSFNVTASSQLQELRVYVGVYVAQGTLTVKLGTDAAIAVTSFDSTNIALVPSGFFTIRFMQNNPGDVLSVEWKETKDNNDQDNILLSAATLTANVPEPASLSALGFATAGLLLRRRHR